MTVSLARIPSPGHGLEDSAIAMAGSSVMIDVSYQQHGRTLFGRIEFGAVLAIDIGTELVSGPVAGTYDELVRSEPNEWAKALLAKLSMPFYCATPTFYQIYLSNTGMVNILAGTAEVQMDMERRPGVLELFQENTSQ